MHSKWEHFRPPKIEKDHADPWGATVRPEAWGSSELHSRHAQENQVVEFFFMVVHKFLKIHIYLFEAKEGGTEVFQLVFHTLRGLKKKNKTKKPHKNTPGLGRELIQICLVSQGTK